MSRPPRPDRHVYQRQQCTAKSKRSGVQCRSFAMIGQEVCRMHGGASKAARAAGERRVAERKAVKALSTYGIDTPIEIEPLEALLQELHRTAGIVHWLGGVIGDLGHGVDDDGRLRSGLKQYSSETGERPSVWAELFMKERAHFAKVASDCLRAGVDERRVKLAEDQGRLVADVIGRIVTSLGHDTADPGVREVVRRELTLVAS